jgi:putative transcriptional regulator
MASKKDKVTKDNFEELLLKSASQAVEFTRGELDLTTRISTLIDAPPEYSKTRIKKIRSNLGLSQAVFAKIFGESLSAIQHWEQGQRNMSKPARRLLDLIEKDPETVFNLITSDKAS